MTGTCWTIRKIQYFNFNWSHCIRHTIQEFIPWDYLRLFWHNRIYYIFNIRYNPITYSVDARFYRKHTYLCRLAYYTYRFCEGLQWSILQLSLLKKKIKKNKIEKFGIEGTIIIIVFFSSPHYFVDVEKSSVGTRFGGLRTPIIIFFFIYPITLNIL